MVGHTNKQYSLALKAGYTLKLMEEEGVWEGWDSLI
jgi:hypothetical protein